MPQPSNTPHPGPAPDAQTYRRAALAAAIGLATQLVLAIFIAVTGVFADAITLHAAAWHLFGGIPIWITLWILYHQHRLERLEALEAEQLATSDAEAARLFDEAGQQLALARARLDKLYKYGLNIVTVFVALYLLFAGAGLTHRAYKLIIQTDADGPDYQPLIDASVDSSTNFGILLALVTFVGLVTFLVARAIAGMTRVEAWTALRGGAAYLMGNLAVAIALIVACTLQLAGVFGAFAVLALIIPLFMALLGLEMVLSFVFGVYRPRKPGEVPRAAFDSRVLGFLTRPESLGKIVTETLRYQFGIDFSGSWLYQLLGKALLPLAAFAIALLLTLSSLVFVGPDQQAVITTFGANPRYVQPGLHVKWPWPAGRAETYDVYRVNQTIVGIPEDALANDQPVLWSSEIGADTQEYIIVAPARAGSDLAPLLDQTDDNDDPTATQPGDADQPDTDQIILGEYALLGAAVRWRIDPDNQGLESYLNAARRPQDLIEAVAMEELSRFAASRNIDQLIGINRETAGELIRQRIAQRIGPAGYRLGVEVLSVGLVTVQPPAQGEVATKFQEQAAALQERNTEIERARGDEAKTLAEVAGSREKAQEIAEAIDRLAQFRRENRTEDELKAQRERIEALVAGAGGLASRLIAEARSARTAAILDAEARARQFPTQLAAYNTAPRYYIQRLYYNALAEGLNQGRKIILAVDAQLPPTFRLRLEDQSTEIQGLTGGN